MNSPTPCDHHRRFPTTATDCPDCNRTVPAEVERLREWPASTLPIVGWSREDHADDVADTPDERA